MPTQNYNLVFPFYNQAQSSPEAVALWVDEHSYTYSALAEQAGHVAAWLLQRNQLRPKRVAILSSRSIGAYIGIIGSCWAGAGYVPLNPGFSEKRLAAILKQAEPQALIVDSVGLALLTPALLQLVPPGSILLVTGNSTTIHDSKIDGLDHLEVLTPVEMPVKVGPEAEAYLVFTSGSTGDPSGVVISTSNLAYAIQILIARYPFYSEDKFSQFFDLSFDFSVMDLFVPWQVGASTYVVPDSQKLGPARFIADHRLTVWTCVPSIITMMVRMGMLPQNAFPSLRFSCFSGETLTAKSAKVWQDAAPRSIVVNLYGQTEAPIGSLVQTFGPEAPITAETGGMAIGTLLDGAFVALVDQKGEFLEAGSLGELALAGPHVAKGYLNNEQRTAEKFKRLHHPHYGVHTWYLTGDLGRQDANSIFHFLGRTDNEIKIAGHRVALEGVEYSLRQYSGSDTVGVVPQLGEGGVIESLVGFVVAAEIDEAKIKREMLNFLPKPLVPKRVFAVDELPLNPNGKVDRKKLQQLAIEKEVLGVHLWP